MVYHPSRALLNILYAENVRDFSIERHWIDSYLNAYDQVKYISGEFPIELKLSRPSKGVRKNEAIKILESLIEITSCEGLAYSNGSNCRLDDCLGNYHENEEIPAKLRYFSKVLAVELNRAA